MRTWLSLSAGAPKTGDPARAELHAHYITWFPTRAGSTVLPPDSEEPIMSTSSGELIIDLSGQFNAVEDNYLDTLRSDFAFVVTPQPFVKSLHHASAEERAPVESQWDFLAYPNPTREVLVLRFTDEAAKDVAVLDVLGRQVARFPNVNQPFFQIPVGQFAKGAYWIHAVSTEGKRIKKVIIH